MKNRIAGFGGIQVLLIVAVIGVASLVAIPKYKAFANKAKITEAINLASESKRKIAETYMATNAFPRTASEANAMLTTTVSKPEFVRELKIEHNPAGEKVTIKVFLNDGVVENLTGEDQYIYIAGNKSRAASYLIDWQCGAKGLGSELLPDECQG